MKAKEESGRGWGGRQYHWLSGHESEQTLGNSEGQGSLAWYPMESPWVRHDLATEKQQQQQHKIGN